MQIATGWQFTISATDSANFDAGNWFWAARAFKSGKVFEIGTGELEVRQSLQYSGTPTLQLTTEHKQKKI